MGFQTTYEELKPEYRNNRTEIVRAFILPMFKTNFSFINNVTKVILII